MLATMNLTEIQSFTKSAVSPTLIAYVTKIPSQFVAECHLKPKMNIHINTILVNSHVIPTTVHLCLCIQFVVNE